jgi:hypothetical protein
MPDAHADQVWPARREHLGADEVAMFDQIGDLWPLDKVIEDAAETASITAARQYNGTR